MELKNRSASNAVECLLMEVWNQQSCRNILKLPTLEIYLTVLTNFVLKKLGSKKLPLYPNLDSSGHKNLVCVIPNYTNNRFWQNIEQFNTHLLRVLSCLGIIIMSCLGKWKGTVRLVLSSFKWSVKYIGFFCQEKYAL